MFRMRRYRVFLIFAVIAIGALYHFTNLGELEHAGAASVEGLKNFGQKVESSSPPPASKAEVKDGPDSKDSKVPIGVPSLAGSGSAQPSKTLDVVLKPESSHSSSHPSQVVTPSAKDDEDLINPKATPVAKPKPSLESPSTNKTSIPKTDPADPVLDQGGSRLEIIAETSIPKIHWSQLPEHFPVPTESLIQLPTGTPKVIPKIQHDFRPETAEEKVAREKKRDLIKKVFSFSWAGYKKKAWMQDELSPLSGKFRNPFCAWGATLVDTLDTLYMMDLEDEFEEAVEAVKGIDFTTSPRNDIPLFETVIRYLGGLVAAYDISDGTHRVLLDKAVELADILIGAFDTPNRMPMTFYLWKPTFASQPHRARARVVLAELGSLSVEFTRLAQITKEPKYYDAIARITNELEIWQNNTKMPGLWPLEVDASGCKKPDVSLQAASDHASTHGATNSKPLGIHDGDNVKGLKVTESVTSNEVTGNVGNGTHAQIDISSDAKVTAQSSIETPLSLSKISSLGDVSDGSSAHVAQNQPAAAAPVAMPADEQGKSVINPKGALGKREVDSETGMNPHQSVVPKSPECEPQGLASPPSSPFEQFGIGGQADSTYEYLPKEYMLLGGLEDQYRTIYETAVDTITKDLLYRTMIPDEERVILHPGLAKVSKWDNPWTLKPEGSHLGCFAGGMYAVGAKIFDREGDLKIAKELTDGCVWAYESTTTGIMPESYLAVQCPDKNDCPWNETLWHEKLDPYRDSREQNRLAQQKPLLEADKSVVIEEKEVAVPQEVSSRVVSNPERTSSVPPVVGALQTQSPSLAEKANELPGPRIDNNMFKSTEGSTDTPKSPPAEQSADQSVTLPAGGASVEQTLSPPQDLAAEKSLVKRQLGDISEVQPAIREPDSEKSPLPAASGADTPVHAEVSKEIISNSTSPEHAMQAAQRPDISGSKSVNGTNATSASTPTHEEFVQAKIHDERLPKGMVKVTGSRYLLRPEAIESVFIMYRATGDEYWREKGWEMFKAVEKHTNATYGGAAIADVTSEKPSRLDEMESFWLAETLKYFYLLFSEPSLVSLDDYVLNTEAHPFKRPK